MCVCVGGVEGVRVSVYVCMYVCCACFGGCTLYVWFFGKMDMRVSGCTYHLYVCAHLGTRVRTTSTRRRFTRVSGWTVRGAYTYLYIWERVTRTQGVYACVCMCARENDGARVGFEKQVPACRVPRGRLDSEAATRWQDPRGTTSARLCESVSLSHEYSHPKSTCYPLAPALALARGVRERMNGCRAQARWLLLSTDRESIRRQPRTFAREISIFTLGNESTRLIFDLSHSRIAATRSIWPHA